MPMHTPAEAKSIKQAYQHLLWTLDDTGTELHRDIHEALSAARTMGGAATIREREAGVIAAFLAGFKAPVKHNASTMHGLSRWWQIACMAGARYRTDHHRRIADLAGRETPRWSADTGPECPYRERARAHLRRAAWARRLMRDALKANQTARDRWIESLTVTL